MMPVFHHGSVETIESTLMASKAPIARGITVRAEAEMHNCRKNARRVVISTLPLYAIKVGAEAIWAKRGRAQSFRQPSAWRECCSASIPVRYRAERPNGETRPVLHRVCPRRELHRTPRYAQGEWNRRRQRSALQV